MNLRNHLLREAGMLASSQTVRRIELLAEIARLEARRNVSPADRAEIARLQADGENCAQALIRFGKYRPHQDTPPNCPHCWIVRGEAVALEEGKSAESYRCGACGGAYP